MCCDAEVLCEWVNYISVQRYRTQTQVLFLLFTLINLLCCSVQMTDNCAASSGCDLHKRPLK